MLCKQPETGVTSLDKDCQSSKEEIKKLRALYEADHAAIKDLKRELEFAKSKIATLESKIITLCLDMKDKSLFINGLPEREDITLLGSVHDLLVKIFPRLHQTDIDLVYWTGVQRNQNQPRPVYV